MPALEIRGGRWIKPGAALFLCALLPLSACNHQGQQPQAQSSIPVRPLPAPPAQAASPPAAAPAARPAPPAIPRYSFDPAEAELAGTLIRREARRHGFDVSLPQLERFAQLLEVIRTKAWPKAAENYLQQADAALMAMSKLPPEATFEELFDRIADTVATSASPKALWFNARQMHRSANVGVSLQPDRIDYVVRVVGLRPDGPAERAGLRVGMVITEIDGRPAIGAPVSRMDSRVSSVMLTYQDFGGQLRGVRLEPEEMPAAAAARGAAPGSAPGTAPPVRAPQISARFDMRGDINIITMPFFREDAAQQLSRGIDRAARGYILDLRNNTGGLLDQVVQSADAFLDRGDLVLLEGRDGEPAADSYRAKTGDIAGAKPVIVLINRFTGSGAEIVAAALADNGRVKLIGERTAGDVRIDTIFPLGNYAMRLPTQIVKRPRGGYIDNAGIEPDIAVADNRFRDGPAGPDHILERALAEMEKLVPR